MKSSSFIFIARLIIIITLLWLAASFGAPTTNAVGETSTKFGIFVPASAVNTRDGTLIVTAIQDGTTVDIIDDNTDGDNDDTKTGLALNTGQSYIVYIWQGAVNDDGSRSSPAPKKDGDYFIVKSNKPVMVVSLTVNTDWQHDFVPADNRRMSGTSFYLYRPPGLTSSSSLNATLDIFAYNDNTQVKILDVTQTASIAAGYTSVVSDLQATPIFTTTLQTGEDILEAKKQTVKLDPGRTYHIVSNKDVSVMFGALAQGSSASRDGGAYVPGKNGYSADRTFYFIIPAMYKRPTDGGDERELRIGSFDRPANVVLRGWNTKTKSWDSVARYPLPAFGHAELIGTSLGNFLDSDGLYRNYYLYELTSDELVSVFETNWLETGSYGTSDIAMYISSETGTGAGTFFNAYMGPPGSQAAGGQISHLVVASHQNADVQVYDPDSYGEYIELYNNSSATVSLANWTLTNLDNWQITLPATATIAPGKTFLLEYHQKATDVAANYVYGTAFPSFKLRNDADTLTLSNPGGTYSDVLSYTDVAAWKSHGVYRALERVSPNTTFTSGNSRDATTAYAKTAYNLGDFYGSPGTHTGSAGNNAGSVIINEVMTGRIYLKFALAPDGYRDVALSVAEWEGIHNGEKPGTFLGNPENPYLVVKSSAPVSVMDGNWNDNWLAYGTGILQPDPYVSYTADYYQRRVGQQVLFTAYAYNIYGTLYNPQTQIKIPNGITYTPGSFNTPTQIGGVTPTETNNADGSWTIKWIHGQTLPTGQVYRFQTWGTIGATVPVSSLLSSTALTIGTDVTGLGSFSSQDTAVINVAPSDEAAAVRDVVINEVMPNPAFGAAWIELHNRSTSDINIGGWQLTNEDAFTYTFPADTFIGNDAYSLIYLGAGTNTATKFYAGAGSVNQLSKTADQMSLYSSSSHTTSTLLDFVEWNTTTPSDGQDALAISAGHWVAGNYVATPAQQASTGRDRSASKTNRAADWDNTGGKDADAATPGAINITIAGADVTPPNPVTNLRATAIAGQQGQLNLTWTNPPDTDLQGVKIIRSTSGYPVSALDGTQVFDGAGSATTDTGLVPGSLVYYAAFAYDKSGNISWPVGTARTRAIVPQRVHIAYEDQKDQNWSDWDTNDFVVTEDSAVTLNDAGISSIVVVFSAEARGSAYDHQLNFKMPMAGSATVVVQRYNASGGLIGTNTSTQTGAVNVEVFSHTRTALPGNHPNGTSNVMAGTTRQAGYSTRIIITLADPTSNPPELAPLPPFDPWLHVWDTNADIHVMQTGSLGNSQPVHNSSSPINGRDLSLALAFNDVWSWPQEAKPIWEAYPQYASFVTSGNQTNTAWFNNPDTSKIWLPVGGQARRATNLPAAPKVRPGTRSTRPNNLTNWPQSTTGAVFASPLMIDLNNDGTQELLAASEDGKVYVWKPDGTSLSNWPQSTMNAIRSSPAVADMDGDGDLEVVVGSNDGRLYAWHHTGVGVTGFPVNLGVSIKSSPALADLDGNAGAEIVVFASDARVYIYRGNGTTLPTWTPHQAGTVTEKYGSLLFTSTPAIGDLNGDGHPEIVVGGTDGKVYVWQLSGAPLPSQWPRATGDLIYASPIIVDLNADGYRDVVAASGDGWVYAWRGDGAALAGFPVRVGAGIIASPAIADLDRNGSLEIVVVSLQGKLFVINNDGSIARRFPQDVGAQVYSSPALADLDGDGTLEIIVASLAGKLRAWFNDGYEYEATFTPTAEWPKTTGDWITGAPTFGDLNNDGKVDLAVGSYDGKVYAWTELYSSYNVSTPGWYTFHGNAARTGLLGANDVVKPLPSWFSLFFPSALRNPAPPASAPVTTTKPFTNTFPLIFK